MTFDIWMIAIAYFLLLFVWLPWKVIKSRKRTTIFKVMVNAHQFYLRYRAVQGLNKNLNNWRKS